jgi:hypothetical protein
VKIMKHLLREQRISLSKLAGEQDISTPTAWRWAQRGIKGIRLETFSLGGRKFTTREAFERFVEQVSRAASYTSGLPSPSTPRRAEANRRQAEQELNQDGI